MELVIGEYLRVARSFLGRPLVIAMSRMQALSIKGVGLIVHSKITESIIWLAIFILICASYKSLP